MRTPPPYGPNRLGRPDVQLVSHRPCKRIAPPRQRRSRRGRVPSPPWSARRPASRHPDPNYHPDFCWYPRLFPSPRLQDGVVGQTRHTATVNPGSPRVSTTRGSARSVADSLARAQPASSLGAFANSVRHPTTARRDARKHWASGALGDHRFRGIVSNANVRATANRDDLAVRLNNNLNHRRTREHHSHHYPNCH
jgi:hypothetical protein